MVKHFRSLTLPQGASTLENVFNDGYSAGHNLRDRRPLSKHIASMASSGVLAMVPKLLGAMTVGRVITKFKTALKPGYSALIPAVAIIFYAQVKLASDGLH